MVGLDLHTVVSLHPLPVSPSHKQLPVHGDKATVLMEHVEMLDLKKAADAQTTYDSSASLSYRLDLKNLLPDVFFWIIGEDFLGVVSNQVNDSIHTGRTRRRQVPRHEG